jgi:integrase
MIVRLKGVKVARAKGRVYYYHRATMTRLPGTPGSAEFVAKLRALDTGPPPSVPPDTLGGLIAVYRASPEFLTHAPRTRYDYQRVFDGIRKLDGMPLAEVTTDFLYELRDDLASRSRSAANTTLKVLRLLFSWGMKRGRCAANPAAAVDAIRRPRDAKLVNRPWRRDEVDQVLAEATPWLRVAVALAAYTGLRQGDVARVTWACYDGRSFETRTQKTGRLVWIPAHRRLCEILEPLPRTSLTIVLGARGRPMTAEVLRNAFFRLIRRLVAEGKIAPGLSFHGLRHTLGTFLAEEGCDVATIAFILGHAKTATTEGYTKTANRRELAGAAMARLERRDGKLLENQPVTD